MTNNTVSFPVTGEELHSVLAAALDKGAEYADVFMEDTRVSGMELQDDTVGQAQQAMIYGAGIRAVKGAQTGFAYTMDLSPQAMRRAAAFAGSMFRDSPRTSVPTLPLLTEADGDDGTLAPHEARELLLTLNAMAKAADKDVIRVKASVAQRMQKVSFVCSEGTAFSEYRPRTTLLLSVVMERDGATQSGFGSRMFRRGADFITPQSMEELVRQTVSRTAFLFTARQIEGGEMPVVMASGGSGIFMHEALGHAFEADFIRTGESVFSGKTGTRVCRPGITIVDDGTLPYDAGMLAHDDEGTPGQRTVLVEDGILQGYLHDRITARHFGVRPTGNGRRESFREIPLPRMRSTYMLPGEADAEDIIRSVKRGVYAMSFTNGQVQIGAGDFTFFMKHGYLIEDGRLTMPLRDLNITGNGPQALRDISMVGRDLTIDHSASMCGKDGQRVPVSQGLPTVLVDRLVVG